MRRELLQILDELEYVTFDLAGAELLFQLLATRYETMSTIITSNLGFSDWLKVFHDRALTAAILDRITGVYKILPRSRLCMAFFHGV